MSNKVSYLFIAQDKFSRIADKVERKTRKVRGGFGKLSLAAKKSAVSFKKSAATFVKGFGAMFTAAAAFFGIRGFLTVGARFQDSMADLSAITGAAGEDLQNLQNTIFSLAKASSTSADEVAEAFKLVASAKPELLENLDALASTTEQVLLLKNAAGIELADAANIAAQGLNIFGVGADQAARFVNVLAAGAKLGSSEIRDTGAAMLLAGPIARAAGLSFEQLNSAIQATAKGGIKGAQAGTALSAIFGRMQRAGIDFQKLGLQGSFELIKKKMDSLTGATDRALFAADIFGEEHSKVGFSLLNNVRLLGQYEKSLAGTNIAQEQANIRLATFSAKARRMGVIFKESVIKAFIKLAPVLTKLTEDVAVFLEGIKPEHIGTFVQSIKEAIGVAKVFGTGLKVVADVLGVIGFVVTPIFNLIISLLTVVFGLIKGIVSAFAQLAAAILTLDFSGFSSIADMFRTDNGKVLGLFGGGDDQAIKPMDGAPPSRTDVNVNLNAPAGAVESVKSKTTGKVSGMNVGVNMVGAL